MSHEEKSPFNNIWSVQNFPNNNSRLGFNSGNNKFMRNKKGHDQVENSKGSIASSAKLKETMLCLAYSRWSLLVKTNKESGLEFKVKLNLMLKKWDYTRRIKIKLAKSKNQRGEHLFLYTWWWEGAHIFIMYQRYLIKIFNSKWWLSFRKEKNGNVFTMQVC
jgi:hypothetical protein